MAASFQTLPEARGHPVRGPICSVPRTVATSFLPNGFREDGKKVYFCVCHADRPEVTGERCEERDRGPGSGGISSAAGVVTGGPGDRCVSPLLRPALINDASGAGRRAVLLAAGDLAEDLWAAGRRGGRPLRYSRQREGPGHRDGR